MAHIVVADDEAAVRRILARYLRRLGHTVIEVDSGAGVLEAIGSGSIDLIFSDINMPGMDGIEVLRALVDAEIRVPLIAMSGGGIFPKALLLDNAEALGAFATVQKPFGFDVIGKALTEALGERA